MKTRTKLLALGGIGVASLAALLGVRQVRARRRIAKAEENPVEDEEPMIVVEEFVITEATPIDLDLDMIPEGLERDDLSR